MTAPSAALYDWDRRIVWHAFTQMAEYEPLIIERAEGCYLIDVEGRRYLDGVASLWCNVHGHRHPRLDAALRKQLDQVAHVTSLGLSNSTTIEFAKALVDRAPPGLNHVFFSSDGSSAVEVALKIAFQYWRQRPQPQGRKVRFIALDQAYHGDTLGSVSVGGVERFHEMFRPLLFDVIRLPVPDTYRLPDGVSSNNSCAHYLGIVERSLAQYHPQVAAVIVEPLLQAAAGMIRHPSGFLRGLRELTRKYHVLLIADEIAVGFGRTGTMFACPQEEVTPDLLCLGKGITGGYLPLAATLATTEIWEAFLGKSEQLRTFFHGHTYGGNPLAAAVGLASLHVFEQERTLEQLPAKCARLRQNLSRLANHSRVGDIRQLGLIAGVELVRDRATRQAFAWSDQIGAQVCRRALVRGVWLRPLGNVLVIMPPLSITLEQLDQICDAVCEGICDVLGAE